MSIMTSKELYKPPKHLLENNKHDLYLPEKEEFLKHTFIELIPPSLHEQLDTDVLILFRNCIPFQVFNFLNIV